LIEDAAESLGATYKGRHSGSIGYIGTFSFNGNKIITTSGGGMLVARDGELIKKARFLATQARDPAPYYEHSEIGYNYRMSNVLAGIGRGQLRVLEDRVQARRTVFQRYAEGLAGFEQIQWMPEASFGRSTRWLTAATLSGAITTAAMIELLAAEKIEARRVWKPMHLQPLFASAAYYRHSEREDVAGRLFADGICLPSGSNMSAQQLDRIVDVVGGILRR
jgi:pyridoxal phosphate-dependent aminotransferase EpsN